MLMFEHHVEKLERIQRFIVTQGLTSVSWTGVDFDQVLHAFTINDSWGALCEKLNRACVKFIPRIRISSNRSPVWFTAEIRHNLNKIHSIRRSIKSKSTTGLLERLSKLETEVQCVITNAKDNYISNLTSTYKEDSGKLYRYLRNLQRRPCNSVFMGENSEILCDPLKIACSFNSLDVHCK